MSIDRCLHWLTLGLISTEPLDNHHCLHRHDDIVNFWFEYVGSDSEYCAIMILIHGYVGECSATMDCRYFDSYSLCA